jgi:hypothetical protein
MKISSVNSSDWLCCGDRIWEIDIGGIAIDGIAIDGIAADGIAMCERAFVKCSMLLYSHLL